MELCPKGLHTGSDSLIGHCFLGVSWSLGPSTYKATRSLTWTLQGLVDYVSLLGYVYKKPMKIKKDHIASV